MMELQFPLLAKERYLSVSNKYFYMKCIYCINGEALSSGSVKCKIALKNQGLSERCTKFIPESERIEIEKHRIEQFIKKEPFIFTEFLKDVIFSYKYKKRQKEFVIKELKVGYFTIIGYLMISPAVGIIMLFYGYIQMDLFLKKVGAILMMPLFILLFFYNLFFVKGYLTAKKLLVLTERGISINGEFVEWENYIGFYVTSEGLGRYTNYYIQFVCTKNLKKSTVELRAIQVSAYQLRQIIDKNFTGKPIR